MNKQEFDSCIDEVSKTYEEQKDLLLDLVPPISNRGDERADKLWHNIRRMRDIAATALQDVHRLSDYAVLVEQMRTQQKQYFATRSKAALIQSKELEQKVDAFFTAQKTQS